MTKRLFYALWPDQQIRAGLADLQEAVCCPDSGRKVPPENLHLTLVFLGNQEDSLVAPLGRLLDGLPGDPLMLRLDRLGWFAKHRVAWVGMTAPPDNLFALHASLQKALIHQSVGFERAERFTPHITLARNAGAFQATNMNPMEWEARCVALVESTNHPTGVRYRVLRECTLGPENRSGFPRVG